MGVASIKPVKWYVEIAKFNSHNDVIMGTILDAALVVSLMLDLAVLVLLQFARAYVGII
jgi:hypothetical protein